VAACLIGNSSAGIKECSYLGTPVVTSARASRGGCTPRTSCTPAIRRRYRRRRPRADRPRPLRPSQIYHGAGASQAIVDVLAGVELYTQKRFCDNREARATA